MPKNYTDLVDAMADAKRDGHSVQKVILTESSLESFMTDGKFTKSHEEKQDQLGEFAIELERGDGDYILTETGERFPL